MYKLPTAVEGKTPNLIIRISDNAFIPIVEDNRDYQEYLAWVAAGNTPEPADE